MKLIIDMRENLFRELKQALKNEPDSLNYCETVIANGIPMSTTLKQIREEIERTYYSQGAGFDDFPHGFICAKNEDMEIIDKYIQRTDMRGEENG